MQQVTEATDVAFTGLDVDAALCTTVSPEIFFDERSRAARRAIAVCRDCPIRPACARYALENGVEGIWGGLTVADRRRIWREAGRGRYNPYGATAGVIPARPYVETPEAIAKRAERSRAAA